MHIDIYTQCDMYIYTSLTTQFHPIPQRPGAPQFLLPFSLLFAVRSPAGGWLRLQRRRRGGRAGRGAGATGHGGGGADAVVVRAEATGKGARASETWGDIIDIQFFLEIVCM